MKLSEIIAKDGIVVEKKAGESVFFQGDSDQHLYLLIDGLLKAYYTSEEGKVFIKSFIQQNEVIGSLSAAFGNNRCTYGVECLLDCRLIKLPFAKLMDYSKGDLAISNEINNLLIQLAMKKERREYEFLCLSAEKRYLSLIEKSPALLKHVTQNDLAAYLGVTPVAYSRIKSRCLELVR